MIKRLAAIGAWALATLATGAITLAAVGQAGGSFSDRPSVPVAAEDLAVRVSTGAGSTSTPPTSMADSTTGEPGGDGATSSTSASSDPSTEPTTTEDGGGPEAILSTEYRVTAGGTVAVVVVGSELRLSSAFPVQGFGVEVETDGPVVVVAFENHDASTRYVVTASLEEGVVKWAVSGGS